MKFTLLLLASGLASQGALTFTLSEDPASGGVQLAVTGSLDLTDPDFEVFASILNPTGESSRLNSSFFTSGAFDPLTPGITPTTLTHPVLLNTTPSVTSNITVPLNFDEPLHPSSPGLNLSGSSIFSIFLPQGTNPSDVVNFDFTLTASSANFQDYEDAFWSWDSNGGSPGGQTAALVVVPEPSTSLLTSLAMVALLVRRHRRNLSSTNRI